jgi:nicotinamide riboside kinase
MNIGLMGAHGTGKSTLATAIAGERSLTYIPSRAGEVFKRVALSLDRPLTAEERLSVQEAILDQHEADIRRAPARGWVTDRTPLDMAAYVLGDAAIVEEGQQKRALDYVRRCVEATNRHFGFLMLVQPGIPYINDGSRPPPNMVVAERMNATLWGLAMQKEVNVACGFIYRETLDLERRKAAVLRVMDQQIETSASIRRVSGASLH